MMMDAGGVVQVGGLNHGQGKAGDRRGGGMETGIDL